MSETTHSQSAHRLPWVVRPEAAVWSETALLPGEQDAPGREFEAFRSLDGRFSFGSWERAVQRRPFNRPFDEVMWILEGGIELTLDDGTVIIARAGEILVTPKGTSGQWRNLGRTRKAWAIYDESE